MKKRVKKRIKKGVIILAVFLLVVGGYLIYNHFSSEDFVFDYEFDYNSLGLKSGEDAGSEIGEKTNPNIFENIKLNPFVNET